MRKIPNFAIEFISESINPIIYKQIIAFLYDKNSEIDEKEWFYQQIRLALTHTFGYYTIDEIYPTKDYTHEDNNPKTIRATATRYRNQNKKNWCTKVLTTLDQSGNPIEIEINTWKMVMEQIPTFDIKNQLGIDSLDDLYDLRTREVQEWSKSDLHMAEFKYLSNKQPFQIKKALLEYDLIISIANILIDKFHSDLFKLLDATPNALWDNPLFSDKGTKMKVQSDYDAETNKEIYFSDYNVDEDRLLRTIIKVKDDDTIHTNKNIFKSLDQIDKQIILFVLSEKKEEFYTNQKIKIYISDLLDKLELTKGIKNYQTVEAKLERIKSFEFQAIIKQKSERHRDGKARWSIFSDIYINNDDDGRRFAEVVVGQFVHQQIINNQTVQIYSSVLNQIKGNISQILVHALQKERIDRYLQNNSLTDIFEYKYFSGKVKFNKKKIETNLTMIEDSLIEFKNLNIMIKDYKRLDTSFEITFIPLTKTEIHDFFENNAEQSQLTLP